MKRLCQVRSQRVCHIMMWASTVAKVLTKGFDGDSKFTELRQMKLKGAELPLLAHRFLVLENRAQVLMNSVNPVFYILFHTYASPQPLPCPALLRQLCLAFPHRPFAQLAPAPLSFSPLSPLFTLSSSRSASNPLSRRTKG